MTRASALPALDQGIGIACPASLAAGNRSQAGPLSPPSVFLAVEGDGGARWRVTSPRFHVLASGAIAVLPAATAALLLHVHLAVLEIVLLLYLLFTAVLWLSQGFSSLLTVTVVCWMEALARKRIRAREARWTASFAMVETRRVGYDFDGEKWGEEWCYL
ncbi:Uncharacterized protein TCM_031074 [Theobroma cacao]|uniref:Uncharacterized protein n=1 Tax=Theobroma cacao TaxID=3641 RepID=A0A061F687_THECC|nr:Uncharacterized protein TCM_031074 [Theobroma cacao]